MSNKIEFSVNIFPSVGRRGQHAIAISNRNDETVVIGFTSEVRQTKEALSKALSGGGEWNHDPSIDYHTLQVSTNVACARQS